MQLSTTVRVAATASLLHRLAPPPLWPAAPTEWASPSNSPRAFRRGSQTTSSPAALRRERSITPGRISFACAGCPSGTVSYLFCHITAELSQVGRRPRQFANGEFRVRPHVSGERCRTANEGLSGSVSMQSFKANDLATHRQ
jgi:hypothetical protein